MTTADASVWSLSLPTKGEVEFSIRIRLREGCTIVLWGVFMLGIGKSPASRETNGTRKCCRCPLPLRRDNASRPRVF